MNEHGFSRKLLRKNLRTCELGFKNVRGSSKRRKFYIGDVQ